MVLNLPTHNQEDWDAPLNAALNALDTRLEEVEGVSESGFEFFESHGALGYPNDDSVAVQATLDAAAANGRIALVRQMYGCKGDIVQKNTETVKGVGATSFGLAGVGFKAIDHTFRYRYGLQAGQPYPGPLENVVIDGNNVTDQEQLVRAEAVEGVMRDVWIVNGLTDGLDIASSQNCLFEHVSINTFPNGACYRIRNRAAGAQGAGNNMFIRCYGSTANKLVHQDARDIANFWSHDNMFAYCLFEQYQDNCHSIAHIADGEIQFSNCVFTGSSGLLTSVADAVVLIENQIRNTLSTEVTFTNCYFGGGAVGPSDLIRAQSFGAINLINLIGRTNTINAGHGTVLCDDRGPSGGLGNLFRLYQPINLGTGMTLSRGLNGGTAACVINETRAPMRFVMDSVQARPIQMRRDGESFNRGDVDRDLALRWYDGTSATVRASIARSGNGLLIAGSNTLQLLAVATGGRPVASTVTNCMIFDTTLNKPIWSDGTNWRDATGTIV